MSEVNLARYHEPTFCVWEIKVAEDLRIELDILVFDIRTSCCSCTEDYVEFRDGLKSTSPLIGRYCTNNNKPEKIYSSRNILRVKYLSSVYNKQHRNMTSVNKFRAEYRTIPGSFIRGRFGTISSPNYPRLSKGRFLFTIVVPFGWIKLTFKDFRVGVGDPHVFSERCQHDFLTVKEISLVEFNDSSREQTFCGRLKSKYFFSSGGKLSLFYNSTAGNRFAVKYEVVTNSTMRCGGVLTGDAGYIYSYGYPKPYPRNTQCSWNIEVPHGFIELKFLVFNFGEASDSCANGKVDIFDGWSTSVCKIRTNCGLMQTLPHIISRTNRLMVKAMSTDHSSTGIFLLSYRLVEHGFCRTGEFVCVSRKCIVQDAVCDGTNDCSDGSDELNCPTQKKNKTLYVVWVLIVLIAAILMVFWLLHMWRKSVHHTMVLQRDGHHLPRTQTEDYEYEVPSQTGAPPTYNEALLQARSELPSYEEAVYDEHGQAVLLQRDNVMFTNGPSRLVSDHNSPSLVRHSVDTRNIQFNPNTSPTNV